MPGWLNVTGCPLGLPSWSLLRVAQTRVPGQFTVTGCPVDSPLQGARTGAPAVSSLSQGFQTEVPVQFTITGCPYHGGQLVNHYEVHGEFTVAECLVEE